MDSGFYQGRLVVITGDYNTSDTRPDPIRG